jgi:hypothetical protein
MRAALSPIGNATFVEASCTALPLPTPRSTSSVSFETHRAHPGAGGVPGRVARVLKPEGVFVLSCPNKLEYSDKRNFATSST